MVEKPVTHFIGIGGSGMSGLAKIMLESGKQVTGSDLEPSRITEKLEERKYFICCRNCGTVNSNFSHQRGNIGSKEIRNSYYT